MLEPENRSIRNVIKRRDSPEAVPFGLITLTEQIPGMPGQVGRPGAPGFLQFFLPFRIISVPGPLWVPLDKSEGPSIVAANGHNQKLGTDGMGVQEPSSDRGAFYLEKTGQPELPGAPAFSVPLTQSGAPR